jgi:hypothetical protein
MTLLIIAVLILGLLTVLGAVSIGKLNIEITGSSAGLDRVINAVEGKLTGLGKTVERLSGGSVFNRTTLAEGAAAFTGLGAAAMLAWKGVKAVGDAANDLHDAASRVGVTADAMAGLKLAAGGAAEGLEKVIVKFQQSMDEAATGSKQMQQAFARLGLDAATLQAMSPELAFVELIGALDKVENAGQRVALRNEILGRGVTALGHRIGKGQAFWLESLSAMSDYGKATEGLSASSEELGDVTDRLTASLSRLVSTGTAGSLIKNVLNDAARQADNLNSLLGGAPAGAGVTGFDVQRNRMMATLEAERQARERLVKETEKKNAAELESLRMAVMQQHVQEQQAEAAKRAALAERVHAELSRPIFDPGNAAVEFGSAAARREQIQADREHQLAQMNAGRQADPNAIKAALDRIQATEAAAKATLDTIKRVIEDRLQGVRPVSIP